MYPNMVGMLGIAPRLRINKILRLTVVVHAPYFIKK